MAKSRLNHVVAVVSKKKSEATDALTEVYQTFDKAPQFEGLSRVYTKKNAEDETELRPSEKKNPQHTVRSLFAGVEAKLVDMFDTVAAQDYANCTAVVDVEVNGLKLMEKAPVTYLMFLEKQLVNLKNFVDKMPLRDAAEDWEYNSESDLYVTPIRQKTVTIKSQIPLIKYEATEQHPAQVELITKDTVVGHWDERKFSGAITKREREVMLSRLRVLAEAVRVAREEANEVPAPPKSVGAKLLDYVFSGVLKEGPKPA